jgi:hypothetical protein
VFVPSSGPEAWKAFLADPDKHWARGYSARTLAHCWERADEFPPEVRRTLEQATVLRGIEPLLVFPEWKVALPGGRRASQNDAWILARTDEVLVSVTVEGKVDELFDRPLADWKVDASEGKRQRLEYLVSCLGLAEEPPGHVYYQLLHRAASAVIEAERFHAGVAVMIVHSFSSTNRWFQEYREFAALFGIEAEIGVLAVATARNGLPLYMTWVHGDDQYLSA